MIEPLVHAHAEGLVAALGHPEVGNWSEIAYLVGPSYQRQGYAREAVRWLVTQLPPEIWAAIQPTNVRSIALVERLGFARQPTPPARPLGSYDPGDGVWALL